MNKLHSLKKPFLELAEEDQLALVQEKKERRLKSPKKKGKTKKEEVETQYGHELFED